MKTAILRLGVTQQIEIDGGNIVISQNALHLRLPLLPLVRIQDLRLKKVHFLNYPVVQSKQLDYSGLVSPKNYKIDFLGNTFSESTVWCFKKYDFQWKFDFFTKLSWILSSSEDIGIATGIDDNDPLNHSKCGLQEREFQWDGLKSPTVVNEKGFCSKINQILVKIF